MHKTRSSTFRSSMTGPRDRPGLTVLEMWGALKVLAILFGPRLLMSIGSIPAIFAAAKRFFTIRTKRSRAELVLETMILVHLAFVAVRYSFPSHGSNFFLETGIPVDAPAFMIRNRFRAYMDQMQAAHPDLSYDERFSLPGNLVLENHLNQLDSLSQDLRLKENRFVYVRFGHDAYFNCETCQMKRPLDFAWYVAPRACFQYCTLLLLVTILSYLITEKSRWKSVVLMAVFMAVGAEALLLFSPELLEVDIIPLLGLSPFYTYWEHFQFYRLILIGLISIAVVLFDLSPFVSETDLLLRAARQSVAMSAFKLHLGKVVEKITSDNGEGVSGESSTLTPDDLSLLLQPGTMAKLEELIFLE